MYKISPPSPLSLPELSASTLTADLTALLEEACLPGSVSDLEIKVIRHLLTFVSLNLCVSLVRAQKLAKFNISGDLISYVMMELGSEVAYK